MTCEELAQLLPDLLEGGLAEPLLTEAQTALARCPDCQKELEAARQIRELLSQFQSRSGQFTVSAGFEARLLKRLSRQRHGLALVDLTSKSFGLWLIELVNILGHLISSTTKPSAPTTTIAVSPR